MKAYSLALPILAATVLLTGGAGVAVAQDNNTAVCDAATKAENTAKDKLQDAERADRKLKDAEKALKDRNIPQRLWDDQATRANLREIAKADVVNPATNKLESSGGDHPDYWQPRETEVAQENQRANNDLEALRGWSQAKDEANNKKVSELRAKFDAAVVERDKVCGDVTTTPTTPPPPPFNDLDCEGFANLADAQAVLDADRSDPHALDLDGDNIACEQGVDDVNLDTNGDGDTQVTQVPVRVDSGLALEANSAA